jgi:hypothetical protein
MSHGAWLYPIVFSIGIFLTSCSGSRSTSGFEQDRFIGTLVVQSKFGNFSGAQSVSIDAFGNVYVIDRTAPGIVKFNAKNDSVASVIGFGKEHNRFDDPYDIDASLTNSIAVADKNNHRIEIYSKDLIWQATITGHTPGSNIAFGYPTALRASQSGNYFIIDAENKRALSINPANGSQKVFTPSGIESGVGLIPIAIALTGSESLTIADGNSKSLIMFNNALLPQARERYSAVIESSLFSSDTYIYAFDALLGVIRVFDENDLSYQGSIHLPQNVNQPVAISVYKDRFYVLTKENVFVCTKE